MMKKLMSMFIAGVMSISLLVQPVFAEMAAKNISDNAVINGVYLNEVSRSECTGAGKIVTESVGERSFAFVNRGQNGIETWDITDPAAVYAVNTYTDDYTADDYGYVFNSANGYIFLHPLSNSQSSICAYKIEADGTLKFTSRLPIVFSNNPTSDLEKDIKIIDGKYLFVSGRMVDTESSNNSPLKIIDVSNPGNMKILKGISASSGSGYIGISTRLFDVCSIGNGIYRIFAINRDTHADGDKTNVSMLKIQDYNAADNSVTNKYYGVVNDESGLKTNVDRVSSVDALNANTLLISYSDTNSTEIIDVSEPSEPKLKGSTVGAIGNDTVSDVYVLNENVFVTAAKTAGAISTYFYNEGEIQRVYPKVTLSENGSTLPISGIAENNGYLFVSASNGTDSRLAAYNLVPEIRITSNTEISAENPVITGTIKGVSADAFMENRAEAILKINGNAEYLTDIVNGKFSFKPEDFEENKDISLTAQLYLNNSLVSSDSKTVRISVINDEPTTAQSFENIGTVETAANDIFIDKIAEKSYAYINMESGGIKVVDITNPQNMTVEQTIDSSEYTIRAAGSGKIFCTKNGDGSNIYVFGRIIDFSNPIETISVGNLNGKLKVADNKYLFVPRRNAVGTYVYDISGETAEKIIELPSKYHEDGVGISHNAIDVVSKVNGKYLAAILNREHYNGAHQYDLLLLEIDTVNKTYTMLFEGKPKGCPEKSLFTENIPDFSVFCFINDHTLIRGTSAGGNNARDTDIIDLTNPSEPTWKASINFGYGYVKSAVGIDDNSFILGATNPNKIIWRLNGDSCERVYTDRTVKTRPQAMEENNGFLFIAESDALNAYKLATGIGIITEKASEENAVINGTVDGFLNGDTVKITVEGKDYTADVVNGKFEIRLTDKNTGKKLVTAAFIRNGEKIASYSKFVNFAKAEYVINSITVSQNGNVVENIGNLSDGTADITVNITNSDIKNYDDAKVYVALYYNDKLIAANVSSLSLNVGESKNIVTGFSVSAKDASEYKIRAFVWGENLKTLASYKKLEAVK